MMPQGIAEYLASLVHELRQLPAKTEWVEINHNKAEPDEIDEYVSALANAAALAGKSSGYLVWGIDDATHVVVDTTFRPATRRVGNEELESWVLRLLEPSVPELRQPGLLDQRLDPGQVRHQAREQGDGLPLHPLGRPRGGNQAVRRRGRTEPHEVPALLGLTGSLTGN